MMNAEEILLITNADTDNGCAIARELLASGHRVAVTARHPAALSRILLGQSADHVFAVAADFDDDAQRAGVLQRAWNRFDRPVTRIVDGRSGTVPRIRSLQVAS